MACDWILLYWTARILDENLRPCWMEMSILKDMLETENSVKIFEDRSNCVMAKLKVPAREVEDEDNLSDLVSGGESLAHVDQSMLEPVV